MNGTSSQPGLLGLVACRLIAEELKDDNQSDAFAKLAMSNLGSENMVEIALAVSQDSFLGPRVEIALQRYEFERFTAITPEMLTDEPSTELRTAKCAREARLFALIDDRQGQSNSQVTKVDKDLLLDPETANVWVEAALARHQESLADQLTEQLVAAVTGLFQIDQWTVRQIVAYLDEVVRIIKTEGIFLPAVGRAFWKLDLPSYPDFYELIDDKTRHRPSAWRSKLKTHSTTRAYLNKYTKLQQPITKQHFESALRDLGSDIDDSTRTVLSQFIDAADGDSAAVEAVAKEDWARIRPLFEGAKRSSIETIGDLTHNYFNELKDKTPVSDEDKSYIEKLVRRGARPPKDTPDEQFYERHLSDIQGEKKLAAAWDKFIFGTEIVCTDFRLGLLQCLSRLSNERRKIPGPAVLEVKADQHERKDYRDKTQQACQYFEKAYRGLQNTLNGLVEFSSLRSFDYEDVLAQLSPKPPKSKTAKKANQLTFQVVLRRQNEDASFTGSLRLVWNFNPDSVLGSFADDVEWLKKLNDHFKTTPLVRLVAARDRAGRVSHSEQLNLQDCSDLRGRQGSGLFVPSSTRAEKLDLEFLKAVESAQSKNRVSQPLADELRTQFSEFVSIYGTAIEALNNSDIQNPALDQQANAYGALLEAVSLKVTADDSRTGMLRPLLEIGIANITDNGSTKPLGIVCPWHPLRLQALHAREIQLSRTFQSLLGGSSPDFTDQSGRLYFRDLETQLQNAGSPEVAMLWKKSTPKVVAGVASFGGYTIVEPPIRDVKEHYLTNENPEPTARRIAEIIKSYLELQPHERDNFSVVLYNCDSAGLPTAVVNAIRAPDDDQDTTCQVILTHRDHGKLAQIYENIAAQESDDDAFHVSESSKDFMARVRINIMVNEVALGNSKSDQPTDIAFCQDVISREAALDFPDVPRGGGHTIPAADLKPTLWSRRREMRPGDSESVVYLASPAQTEAGWKFLLALAVADNRNFARGTWESGNCLMPARKLMFEKDETAEIFQQTHALANWVVNFDDLLDRRLLRHKEVKIIRYKQSASDGRNLIISSTAEDHLLRVTMKQKLRPLLPPDASDDTLNLLCTRLINDANDISGNLVLRAAKRGTNANELIGLVLSRHLVEEELGLRTVCLLLDDYAEWLGQKESQVADLLLMAPSRSDSGELRVDIVVTEAKFVSIVASSSSDHVRVSGRQLRDSLRLLERALTAPEAPSDQELWLSRISDLLFEGLQNAEESFSAAELRTALRERKCKICLRGYSHVFIYAAEGDSDGTAYTRIQDTSFGHQEVFARSAVKTFIRNLVSPEAATAPTPLRVLSSGHDFVHRLYTDISPPVALPVAGLKPASPAEAPPSNEPAKAEPEPVVLPALEASNGSASTAVVTEPPSAEDEHNDDEDEDSGGEPVAGDSPVAPTPIPPSTGLNAALGGILSQHAGDGGTTVTDAADEEWLNQIAQKVRDAFLKRNMTAKIVEKRTTPNAALLRFEGSAKLTVAAIEARRVDFKTTDGIDILGVRPEIGVIAIIVARPKRKVLSLFELWRDWNPDIANGNTNLLVAQQESDGSPLFLSPKVNPHTLVAGQTGSGKSVLMQNIILGIAATNTPAQAQLVIIDPKGSLDYQFLAPLPHFREPIILQMELAVSALGKLVAEMERRQPLFLSAQVRNIDEYIKKTGLPLPRIWAIHDEFGDWMQVKEYKEEITGFVNRLAQKARAAGIYLIFASQRPEASIFPMVLRSNLGNRLILKVDSSGTSDLSLGVKGLGAEKLLPHGHMLAITGETNGPVYCQVPYISEEDVVSMVSAICQRCDALPNEPSSEN